MAWPSAALSFEASVRWRLGEGIAFLRFSSALGAGVRAPVARHLGLRLRLALALLELR